MDSYDWMYDGVYHRIGGPARNFSGGDYEWYQNGKLHRENGPAVEYNSENFFQYYIKGKQYSKKKFYRLLINKRINKLT